jgi:hypothetical protein
MAEAGGFCEHQHLWNTRAGFAATYSTNAHCGEDQNDKKMSHYL